MQSAIATPEILFRRAVESYRGSDFPAALETCELVLQQQPAASAVAATYNLKALSLASLGNVIDAVEAIRQAVALKPGEARLHLHAARLLFRLGRHRKALAHLDNAALLSPADPEPDYQAARVFRAMEQPTAALERAWASVRKLDENPEGWMLLAELFAEQGDYRAALECLQPALNREPLMARAWAWLAEKEPILNSGLPIDEKLGLARDQAPTHEDHATAVFALAHRKRRAGLHAEAFALFTQANRNLEKARTFAIKDWEARISEVMAASADADIHREPPGQGRAPRLLFICGMPRSGTSLCEQIICSHPSAHGAGELPTMEYIEKSLLQRAMDPYGEDQAGWQEEMRGIYLNSLPTMQEGKSLLIDKTPRNFERLGLILRLFPGARLLWMLRHPLDTILSCFFQDFAANHDYSLRLDHCARVYLGHMQLLRHWKKLFGSRIKVVNYSAMVLGPEATIRELAEFAGLGFHPAMLQPHLNPRVVRTSSASQVRQPIFTRGIDRWKNYAGELGDLMAMLRSWGLIDAEGRMTCRY